MDIINRNKSIMKPFGEIVEQALLILHTHVVNANLFSQQENDEVVAKLSATGSSLVEHDENLTDDATIFEESSSLPTYTVLVLMPDSELDAKIRSLNKKQRQLFNILQSCAKQHVKNKSVSYPSVIKPLHIFLTGDAGCGKSFLMKVIYQALTKTLSYRNSLVDKPEVFLVAPTSVAANCLKYTSRSLWKKFATSK